METTTGDPALGAFVAELAMIVERVKSEVREVRPQTAIADLRLDSLEMLELLVLIEERCATTLIGHPDLVGIDSVEDLHRLVCRNRRPN